MDLPTEESESKSEVVTEKPPPPPPTSNDQEVGICKDNGVFDFMTPARAIELYKRIHAEEIPDLEWKFHGRKNPQDNKTDEVTDKDNDKVEEQNNDTLKDQTVNTEFDFDENFTDISTDTTSIVNESLQLKKRPEAGQEKKTNLSDIMSDIMKESTAEN